MRILQVIQKPQLRGAEIFACQLSEELIKLGAMVDVAYLYSHSSFDLDFKLKFISLNGDPSKRSWDIKAYRTLAQTVGDGKYDLVQANASDTLKYSVFSKKLFGWKAPIVYRNANKLTEFIRHPLHRFFNRWLLGNCAYYISVSENCRQDLISLIPSAQSRSKTIAVGTYSYNEIETHGENDAQRPVIINVGSLAPEKNHTFLIDVFDAYFKKHGRGSLWIVGDGKLKAQLMEQAERLSLAPHITFWGYRKDVIRLLHQADMLVMPSLIEGIPAAILEALSAGTPVVASAAGGIPEVIKDGVNGFCITGSEKEKYVNRIERIVQDENLRDTLVKNGRDTFRSDYQMTVIAGSFLSTYHIVTNEYPLRKR
jgi:glycosyltransferase involved in cell wall biosynthesis